MRRGKHTRRSGHGWLVAVVAVAALAVLGGGTAFAAYRYDVASSSRILPGVRVDGIDVGGMTRDEAVRAISARADEALARSLAVSAAGYRWTLTPAALGTRADVEGAVGRAFAVADSVSFFSRVHHRLTEEPVGSAIAVGYVYDEAAIRAFVQQAYEEVATPAVDAAIRLVDGELRLRRAREGEMLRADLAVERIGLALERHMSAVRMPVRVIEPGVRAAALGKTIVVDLSENMLYLYEGLKVTKEYRVATAAPGYSTPVGTWKVIDKRENPGWYNPAPDGWGADLPMYIPPGPGNPLGTRALYLNAPGIRIHGTYKSDSIGTYASRGCIRMLIAESEELYPLVEVGARVIVKP